LIFVRGVETGEVNVEPDKNRYVGIWAGLKTKAATSSPRRRSPKHNR